MIKFHAKYSPRGAAIPPTIPLPELSGPVRDSVPRTAPTFARNPAIATHPGHLSSALVSQVITATATKTAVPAKAAGAASKNPAVCSA
jgi:hypothetical protein